MESLIRTWIFALLIAGSLGRSLRNQVVSRNSSDGDTIGELEIVQKCNWRYYKHYETKGCELEAVDSRGCPTNYICPPANVSVAQPKVCVYQNVEYEIGDKISLNDKCQVCRCVDRTKPHINCRHRECPQMEPIEGSNCHLVYEENKCCPLRYECEIDAVENAVDMIGFACTYNNKTYPLGARIYPSDDTCTICTCNKNWNGVDNSSCHQQECVFEKNKHLLDAGCIPVYHETKCCPIEYYCPENPGISNLDSGSSLIPNEEFSEFSDQCHFAGNTYDIGMEIPNSNVCIKCSCQVSPDFTCVYRSCSPPPNVENCYSSYIENQCCPTYECLYGDDNTYANVSEETICPTPLCADKSCEIGILPGHQCPTCICDEVREKNDFEPKDIEMYNETQGPENEIFEQMPFKNSSEREPLSQIFIEELSEKDTFDYEEIKDLEPRMQDSGTALQNHRESTYNETETDLELDTLYPINGEELDNNKTASNELRPKRSENLQTAFQSSNSQQQWDVLQQDQLIEDPQDSLENSDRELEGSNENYDEVKIFSTKGSQKAIVALIELDDNEFENVIWTTEVPGCPSPMCADSSCRIGIPQGHSCPTCVCKKRRNRQP